jgi:beta-lactamase regulating signal transducer with metallopeptidase domain
MRLAISTKLQGCVDDGIDLLIAHVVEPNGRLISTTLMELHINSTTEIKQRVDFSLADPAQLQVSFKSRVVDVCDSFFFEMVVTKLDNPSSTSTIEIVTEPHAERPKTTTTTTTPTPTTTTTTTTASEMMSTTTTMTSSQSQSQSTTKSSIMSTSSSSSSDVASIVLIVVAILAAIVVIVLVVLCVLAVVVKRRRPNANNPRENYSIDLNQRKFVHLLFVVVEREKN